MNYRVNKEQINLEPLIVAKRVITNEAAALEILAQNIPADFVKLVDFIISLRGKIIVTGIGKSGYIARKIAASFSSTGTVATYLHPAEASHGDLGAISDNDLVIMLSNSGETKELFDIIKYSQRFNIPIAAITMNANSNIARNSDFLLLIPNIKEVSNINAPTTSSILMLAIGDALMTAVHELQGFSSDDFKIYHPGGKIGANLLKVGEVMRRGSELPIVSGDDSFSATLLIMNKKTLGCALVTGDDNKLIGIITDGDLRRHLKDSSITKYAHEVMNKDPVTIAPEKLAAEALSLMNKKSITQLPVIDNKELIGLLHIHDLLKIGIK